jgi:hypothetical protein
LWGERIAEKRVTVPDACVSGYALADETRVIDLPASDAHPLRIDGLRYEEHYQYPSERFAP